MMKLMIDSTSQKLRKILNNGINCVTSLVTPEGYVLLGGTFSQRSWLAGDDTQGMSIEKRQGMSIDELEELKEGDGHVYIFENTLYVISESRINNIKYPLQLLETFKKAGLEITDLR
jgi:hypothetical protein